MATKAWVAKQARREELVKRYADIRRQLKKEKNFAALAKLPRDSSPTRSHLRCQLTGRLLESAPKQHRRDAPAEILCDPLPGPHQLGRDR